MNPQKDPSITIRSREINPNFTNSYTHKKMNFTL